MSGKKLDYLGVSAFCESMAMMVQAGTQTDEAITLLQSDRTHGNGVLEEGLSVMKEQVDQGSGLAAAMKESGIFPDYALQMVEAGERSDRIVWSRVSKVIDTGDCVVLKLAGGSGYFLFNRILGDKREEFIDYVNRKIG